MRVFWLVYAALLVLAATGTLTGSAAQVVSGVFVVSLIYALRRTGPALWLRQQVKNVSMALWIWRANRQERRIDRFVAAARQDVREGAPSAKSGEPRRLGRQDARRPL